MVHDLLELPDEVLKEGTVIGPALTYTVPEHGVRLRPDFAIVDPDAAGGERPARTPIDDTLPAGTKLDERLSENRNGRPDAAWTAWRSCAVVLASGSGSSPMETYGQSSTPRSVAQPASPRGTPVFGWKERLDARRLHHIAWRSPLFLRCRQRHPRGDALRECKRGQKPRSPTSWASRCERPLNSSWMR